jgi:hypothetical protein
MKALLVVISKPAQYSFRISVALALAVMLNTVGSEWAFGYSCPGSNHCYGANTWSRPTEYFGVYTDISVVHLNCDPTTCAQDGFISDEIWLIDMASCPGQPSGMCWIETGYIDFKSTDQTLFWTDQRPGQPFAFGLMANVPTGDYGNRDHFMIIKDGRTSLKPFLIFMYNDSLSTLFEGTSNDNSMVGKRILIGQELQGTGGASAPQATFTRNIFAVQALGPEYVFWYNVQTKKGPVTSNNPPMGQWNIDPATSGGSPEGGQFSTSCC